MNLIHSASGLNYADIARQMNVSPEMTRAVLRGRTGMSRTWLASGLPKLEPFVQMHLKFAQDAVSKWERALQLAKELNALTSGDNNDVSNQTT